MNNNLLPFMLLAILLIPTESTSKVNIIAEDFSPYIGYCSCLTNEKSFNDDITSEIVPTTLCKCLGLGYVLSGDGIAKITCVCGVNCKCNKPDTVSDKCPCGCNKLASACHCKQSTKTMSCLAPISTSIQTNLLMGTEKDPIYYSYLFTAKWCNPCNQIKDKELPKLKDWKIVHNKWETGANIVLVDIDEYPELARQYLIDAIPRLVVVRNGTSIGEKTGFMTYLELAQFHNTTITNDREKRK